MSGRTNFADPEYEPTDDDLNTLASEAFADVPARNERIARALRERIALRRAQVLRDLAARWGTPGDR